MAPTSSSGIVWAVTTQSTRSGGLAPGTLRAFRASNISQEIYNSDINHARDALGDFTKFAPPVVANGKVYVPTQSKTVTVYWPSRALGYLGGTPVTRIISSAEE